MSDQPVVKAVAFVLLSEEAATDARGWMDRVSQALAADRAADGERYRGVFRRGYHAGADAAFAALLAFIEKGGRVGLPMGSDSLHMISADGTSTEVMSLLALRPWSLADQP